MTIENTSFLKEKNNPFYFGEEMEDGRLTADYDTTTITHFRELVKKRTELGRPLTEDEMAEFEVCNKYDPPNLEGRSTKRKGSLYDY